MEYLWGIDLGGTKIECAVIEDSQNLNTLVRERIATEADQGYSHIINQIEKLIKKVSDELGIKPKSIGFGTPGAIEPTSGLIKNSNTTCINGKPLQKDLESKLNCSVFLMNDANCFCIAESNFGTPSEMKERPKSVFGIIMGTGVGGGICIDGKALNGRHSIGGEWGHNYLDESGGTCYCGRQGCVEQVISGPATERYYRSISNQNLNLKDIVIAYRKKDNAFATETMERLFDFYAKGLAQVVNILDPDVIVMGGGLSKIEELYIEGPKRIKKYIFNDDFNTPIVRPKLGDSAGVYGAALLNRK
ncbi:ROK family protein [Saprospiraceae bacterium]|nr:ROK family protein [Saprospiraceae bacterium]